MSLLNAQQKADVRSLVEREIDAAIAAYNEDMDGHGLICKVLDAVIFAADVVCPAHHDPKTHRDAYFEAQRCAKDLTEVINR